MSPSRPTNPRIASAELFIDPPIDALDGEIEFGARLVEENQFSQRLWFRFPRAYDTQLTRRADPFVIATAVHALHRYDRLQVHGTVSEGLIANLAEFHAAFAAFHGLRHHEPVIYGATRTAEPERTSLSSVGLTAFSGGVDSCFSVYRHTALSTLEPKRPVGAALMMHGFDIPVGQDEVFARSAARSKQLTDDAGLQLLTGVTNLRILPIPWEDTFAAAVAGALSFFQPAFAFGLVPSFQEWTQTRLDHGSNPVTDPLLSSASFQIIHDGARFGRIEKLRHLAGWPGALRNLRVCWQGAELDRNCCVCEKCLRTMLMLDVCGVSHCEAFPQPVSVEAVSRLVIRNQSGLDEFGYLLAEADRLGLQKPWLQPAQRMLRRNIRNQRWWQKGKSLANLVPTSVRSSLGRVGHRMLWRAPHARVGGSTPASPASRPVMSQGPAA